MFIYAACAVLVLLCAYQVVLGVRPKVGQPLLWLAVFCAWAGLSISWSGDWRAGALAWPNYLVAFFIFWASIHITAPQLHAMATVALAGVAGMGLYRPEWFGGFGNENFQAEYIIIVLPLLLAGRGHWRYLSAIVAAFALFVLFRDTSSKLPYFAGLGLYVICVGWLFTKRHWFWALFTTLVPLNIALFSGVFGQEDMYRSVAVRLELYINTVNAWLTSPIWGHGLGGFNWIYPKFQESHYAIYPQSETVLTLATFFAGAAHNEYLQVLNDFGMVGALLATLFLLSLLLNSNPKPVGPLLSIYMLGWLSLIGFPLQNPATVTVGAVVAGVLARGASFRLVCAIATPLRLSAAAAACFLSLAAAAAVPILYEAERAYTLTRLTIEKKPLKAFASNIRAHQLVPWNAQYRRQLILTLGRVLTVHGDRVQLSDSAADKVYWAGQSTSPWNPSVQASHVQYLLNTGRWKENLAEINTIMAGLKSTAPHQVSIWMADAWVGIFTRDVKRVLNALDRARQLPRNEFYTAQIKKITSLLVYKKVEPK